MVQFIAVVRYLSCVHEVPSSKLDCSVYSISSITFQLIRTTSLPDIVFTGSHGVVVSTPASDFGGLGLQSLFGDRQS